MNNNNKESVTLRQRVRPSGRIALYLDIYRRGVRKVESLKLYLIPEKNRADKEKNRQTLQLAEAIRSKRHIEVIKGEYGFNTHAEEDILFFPYAEMLLEQKASANLYCVLIHLRQYEKRELITFAEITTQWVDGFLRFLDNTKGRRDKGEKLSTNTKRQYFNALKTIIHHAQRKGVIHHDPISGVDNWRAEDTIKEYLTIEEVRKMTNTRCDNEAVKKAFLFSCLTGLRRSDVERITWGDVQDGTPCRLVFRQKKTKGLEYLDINAQARALMGERGANNAIIFPIPTQTYTNAILRQWALRAGIDKHITFHCGRHTFATMMLSLGTDIYTVSKLLGHRDLATTQVYVKVLDKKKQEAVANIPDIFGKTE